MNALRTFINKILKLSERSDILKGEKNEIKYHKPTKTILFTKNNEFTSMRFKLSSIS